MWVSLGGFPSLGQCTAAEGQLVRQASEKVESSPSRAAGWVVWSFVFLVKRPHCNLTWASLLMIGKTLYIFILIFYYLYILPKVILGKITFWLGFYSLGPMPCRLHVGGSLSSDLLPNLSFLSLLRSRCVKRSRAIQFFCAFHNLHGKEDSRVRPDDDHS